MFIFVTVAVTLLPRHHSDARLSGSFVVATAAVMIEAVVTVNDA